jgi:hypothetical protein
MKDTKLNYVSNRMMSGSLIFMQTFVAVFCQPFMLCYKFNDI